MKTTFKSSALLAAVMLFTAISSFAQSMRTCCRVPSTTEFAMLGKNESFKTAHLSPLPFHFVPAKGKL
ncbi:MAG TPA: hypothetical protein VI757_12860, partial [Bacteroidia bacterium]|nr:hypothetical protein [Bacteroidia bacterium]